MKIVFFSRLFYPHIGGVEKHVLELSKTLIKHGHKVTVITEKYDKKLHDQETVDKIVVRRVNIPKSERLKKYYIWWWFLSNRSIIQNAKIVHIHDVFIWYLPFKILYPFRKVYTTFHGYEGNNIPGRKELFMHKVAEKLSYGNICVGKFLEKWYGTKATYVTYGAARISGRPSNTPKNKAVFVGRLEPETGIMTYLKSLKILKEKSILLDVVVLGDGSLMEKAIKFCKKNNLKVSFIGFVTDVDRFLLDSKIVFTSRYLGILEALACTRFVVCEYNSKIKFDYLNMTPFRNSISINKKPEEIAESVEEYILSSKDKNIKNGSDWAKKQTWENLAELYKRLWKT